ncbi:hypothetical protein Tco_1155218 [Tanacetum coccineum]
MARLMGTSESVIRAAFHHPLIFRNSMTGNCFSFNNFEFFSDFGRIICMIRKRRKCELMLLVRHWALTGSTTGGISWILSCRLELRRFGMSRFAFRSLSRMYRSFELVCGDGNRIFPSVLKFDAAACRRRYSWRFIRSEEFEDLVFLSRNQCYLTISFSSSNIGVKLVVVEELVLTLDGKQWPLLRDL